MTYVDFKNIFPTVKSAVNLYIKLVIKDKLICPYCQLKDRVNPYRKDLRFYYCRRCNNTFSIFRDSIFRRSRTDIRAWFYAIYKFFNTKKDFSIWNFHREIMVSYKCALNILTKIRTGINIDEMKDLYREIIELGCNSNQNK
jgi:transposase-like protein